VEFLKHKLERAAFYEYLFDAAAECAPLHDKIGHFIKSPGFRTHCGRSMGVFTSVEAVLLK